MDEYFKSHITSQIRHKGHVHELQWNRSTKKSHQFYYLKFAASLKIKNENWNSSLTSVLRPDFYAVPVVLLATGFAWKHPSCSLTSFMFTTKTYPAHNIDIGLSLFFSHNASWGILLKAKRTQYFQCNKYRENIYQGTKNSKISMPQNKKLILKRIWH